MRTEMPVSAEELYAWHMKPGSFEALAPRWQPVKLVERQEIAVGKQWVIRIWVGPIPIRWVAQFDQVEPGRCFADVQKQGPLHYWRHVHRMIPIDERRSYLEDEVTYSTYSWLMPLMPRLLKGMFSARHQTTLKLLSQD